MRVSGQSVAPAQAKHAIRTRVVRRGAVRAEVRVDDGGARGTEQRGIPAAEKRRIVHGRAEIDHAGLVRGER